MIETTPLDWFMGIYFLILFIIWGVSVIVALFQL